MVAATATKRKEKEKNTKINPQPSPPTNINPSQPMKINPQPLKSQPPKQKNKNKNKKHNPLPTHRIPHTHPLPPPTYPPPTHPPLNLPIATHHHWSTHHYLNPPTAELSIKSLPKKKKKTIVTKIGIKLRRWRGEAERKRENQRGWEEKRVIEVGSRGYVWDLRQNEKEESDERRERKENKKPLNRNSIPICTLSYLRAYCSMSQNFETFSTLDKSPVLCLMCQMCQIFGIWHIWES